MHNILGKNVGGYSSHVWSMCQDSADLHKCSDVFINCQLTGCRHSWYLLRTSSPQNTERGPLEVNHSQGFFFLIRHVKLNCLNKWIKTNNKQYTVSILIQHGKWALFHWVHKHMDQHFNAVCRYYWFNCTLNTSCLLCVLEVYYKKKKLCMNS